MLVPNQKTKVKWNNGNRKWYEEKGYIYTKNGEEFEVDVMDLTKSAKNKVKLICDYCLENGKTTIFERSWSSVLRCSNYTNKHACDDCKGKKGVESKRISGGFHTINQKKAIEKSRLSYEQVKEWFNEKGYELLTKEYINNHQKLAFICKKHVDIGKQYATAISIREVKYNCKKCRKENELKNKINYLNSLDVIKVYDEVLNGKRKIFPEGFFKYLNRDSMKKLLDYFIKLYTGKEEITKEDIINALTAKNLQQYKLQSLVRKYKTLENVLNEFYPEIKYWELNSNTNNYWNQENIRKAGLWLVEQLKKDGTIREIDDILDIKNHREYFRKYKLEGMLASVFNSCVYDFWDFLYPNRWFEWEFSLAKRNYWTNKENRIKALKQLIEERLKINIDDIPNKISYRFLVEYYHKFSLICDQYYQSNLYTWINECYPNKFSIDDFYNTVAKDGTVVDSIVERKIHDLLLDNKLKVIYFENKQKAKDIFYNEEYQESYIPDWIINDNIIVEYFGWYATHLYGKNDMITNYIEKANRKILYYSNLPNYKFIDLYPQDIENNFKGLIDKFNKNGIQIKIS